TSNRKNTTPKQSWIANNRPPHAPTAPNRTQYNTSSHNTSSNEPNSADTNSG
ncbi:hypothetical protein CHS0354_038256, partial [Potamilus streckersoni]